FLRLIISMMRQRPPQYGQDLAAGQAIPASSASRAPASRYPSIINVLPAGATDISQQVDDWLVLSR
ncbi:hypothetical protein K0U00_46295, partial [Paenibacillus sepulcri]|nr:hypothetical protein [Paenibacillus sepulcri]